MHRRLNGEPPMPPLEESDPAHLARMPSAEEADVVLAEECPGAIDVSLSERVWHHRVVKGSGMAACSRLCRAVLLIPGPQGGIDACGTNWSDVLDEVRRQYNGLRRRSA